MSDVVGEVESKAKAEIAQLANVGLTSVETKLQAEAPKLAPLATSFVALHDLWFLGGAFALGFIIGLIL